MNELSGGIRNALEKGDNLEKIKQSFINAGYPREQIEQAAQEINSPVSEPTSQPTITTPSAIQKLQYSPLPTQKPVQKSYFGWIILAIVSLLILVTAGLVGVYWTDIINSLK